MPRPEHLRLLPHGLPKIRPDHFKTAQERAQIPPNPSASFSLAITSGQMEDFLQIHLENQVNWLLEAGTFSAEQVREYYFGATSMFLIFEELREIGYPLPHITEEAIQEHNEKKNKTLRALIQNLEENPIDDTDEAASGAFDMAEKEAGVKIITTDDILSENPVLEPFLTSLSIHGRIGAQAIYVLTREEFLYNQQKS